MNNNLSKIYIFKNYWKKLLRYFSKYVRERETERSEVIGSYRINTTLVTKKVHLKITLFSIFLKVPCIQVVSVTLKLTCTVHIRIYAC